MSTKPLVIEMGFTDIDNLIQDYAMALELDEESRKHNRDLTKIIKTNRRILCFLIVLVLFVYYQPEYIPGLSGEALSEAQFALQDKLRGEKMDYSSVAANVAEYTRYITQSRFSFANGMSYTATELLNVLQEHNYLGPIVKSLVSSYQIIFASGQRLSSVASSVLGLAGDLAQGNINFDRLGTYIGNGLWTFFMYMGFQLGVAVKNLAVSIAERATAVGSETTPRRIEGFPQPTGPRDRLVTIRINNVSQVVTLNDVLTAINNPTQKIIPSIFDAFIAQLFDVSGLWGIGDITDDEESVAETISSFETAKTYATTIMDEKLDEISGAGYGSVDELTSIFKTFNIATDMSIVVIMAAYNNIYKNLLKVYCVQGGTGVSSQTSSQASSQTMSQLSDESYMTSCSRLSVIDIEHKAEEALEKPVESGSNRYQLRKKGESLLLFKIPKNRGSAARFEEEIKGGKHKYKGRSYSKKKKSKRKYTKRKVRRSKRKTHRRR